MFFTQFFHLETTNFAISEVPSVVGRSPEDLEDLWVLCKRLEFAIEAPNGPVEIVDFPIEIVVIFHSRLPEGTRGYISLSDIFQEV